MSYPLSSHTVVPFILKATMVEKSKQIKGEQQLLCVTQKLSGLLVNDCGVLKAIPAQVCHMTSISTFTEESLKCEVEGTQRYLHSPLSTSI